MSRGWPSRLLGDVASVQSGKYLPKELRQIGNIPVFGSNGIIGNTKNPAFDEPVVVVGRVGACGAVAKTSGPAHVSDNALVVRPKSSDLLLDYLHLWLQTVDFGPLVQGTTQPMIRGGDVKNLSLPLPPLDEQRRIAGVLGALDDLIEVNRGLIHELLALSSAMLAREAALAQSAVSLGQIYEVGLGGVWGEDSPDARNSVMASVLRGRDLEDIIEVNPVRPPTRFVTVKQAERREPQVGEIWTAGSGSLGPALPVTSNFAELFGAETVLYSNFVKRLVPKNGDSTWLGAAWLSVVDAWRQGAFENFRTGTAMPNLDADAMLRGIVVPALSLEARERVNALVTLALGSELRAEIEQLAATRDELLPLLMSGRVRVIKTDAA